MQALTSFRAACQRPIEGAKIPLTIEDALVSGRIKAIFA